MKKIHANYLISLGLTFLIMVMMSFFEYLTTEIKATISIMCLMNIWIIFNQFDIMKNVVDKTEGKRK